METTACYMTESSLTLEDGTIIGVTNYCRESFGDWHRLGSLPHDTYELDHDFQDLHEDTRVYLGDEK